MQLSHHGYPSLIGTDPEHVDQSPPSQPAGCLVNALHLLPGTLSLWEMHWKGGVTQISVVLNQVLDALSQFKNSFN